MESSQENFQRKTPFPFILKSLAKKRNNQGSVLSPAQTPRPSSLARIRSSDSRYVVHSIEQRVVRECEDILKKVKRQQTLYQAYQMISPNKKQQLRLQNTIRLLEESIKKKDNTIVKLHRIVKQLESDYHNLVRSAMKGKNSQVYEQYGFEIPKQQRILRPSKLQQNMHEMKGVSRQRSELKVNSQLIQIVIEAEGREREQDQNLKPSIASTSATSVHQAENHRLSKLMDAYKEECFLKQKEMMYQIKYSSERIQQLQNQVRRLKSVSKVG